MHLISQFLFSSIRMATPLTFAGIGESVAQTSGVLNIGVEGMMLSACFTSFLLTSQTGSILVGLLGALCVGMLLGLLHAFFCVSLKQNQTIVGLTINILSLGLTSYVFLLFYSTATELPSVPTLKPLALPLLSKIPILGPAFFDQDGLTYLLYLIIIVSTIFLKRTDYGISLLAVGENPGAADTAGIPVPTIRYLACAFNGLMAGLAGAYMMTVQFGFYIENMTAGRGYMALAAVTLGRRNPVYVFLVTLLIGCSEGLQYTLQSQSVPIPPQVFTMFPYIVAVVVLLFSIGKSADPKALGLPYDRNERA